MATEATGDDTRDAAGAGKQEAAGSETPATEAPVAAEPPEVEGTAGGDAEAGAEAAEAVEAVEPAKLAEAAEPVEPAKLAEAAEPVDLVEPAELGQPAAGAHRQWTRVLVAAGFVVLAAAIVGGAIAIVSSVTHGFKKPVKVTYKKSAVFSLRTGDCFNPVGQQSYRLTPCDSPHRAEVFALFPLSGSTWPGTTAVEAAASSGCATRLTGYLNPQLALSLTSAYVYPDATAWQGGTRSVICEVRASSGDITGSVRGATASAS